MCVCVGGGCVYTCESLSMHCVHVCECMCVYECESVSECEHTCAYVRVHTVLGIEPREASATELHSQPSIAILCLHFLLKHKE